MASGSTLTGKAVFIVNTRSTVTKADEEMPVTKADEEMHEFPHRKGAQEDLTNLQNIFVDMFGFTWENQSKNQYLNISCENWDHKYREDERDCEDCCMCLIRSLKFCDSEKYFLLAISSHGHQEKQVQKVLFSDQKTVEVQEILEAISDENCPNLKGKIRIVILQACRGDLEAQDEQKMDSGANIRVVSGKGQTSPEVPPEGQRAPQWPQDPLYDISPFLPKNFLVVYASPPGRLSFRNNTTGSWVIAKMKEVVVNSLQKGSEVDFLELLTLVNYKVSLLETDIRKKDIFGERWVKDEVLSGKKSCLYIRHRLVTHVKLSVRSSSPLPDPN